MSKRNNLDQYYIRKKRTPQMLEVMCMYITNIDRFYFYDPCAGTGTFTRQLIKKYGSKRVYAFDIDPKAKHIKQEDFLTAEWFYPPNLLISIVCPPFGANNTLAIKFFNKCAEVSEYIVTILPMTAKKKSFLDKLNPQFHCMYTWDLPHNSFLLNGKPYHVNCCFQIWKKLEYKRKINNNTMVSPYFSFVNNIQNASVAIIRKGNRTGEILSCKESLKYARNSSHLIKINNNLLKRSINTNELGLKHTANNAVGRRSISKPEIVYAIDLLMTKLTLPDIIKGNINYEV